MKFVTDRTYADVEYAKQFIQNKWNDLDQEEKEEWLNGLKGYFNYTDLNRIEQNVYDLDSYLMVNPTNKLEWQKTSDTGYGIQHITQNTILILLDETVKATIVTNTGSITTINGPVRKKLEYTNISYSVYPNGDLSKAFLITSGEPVLSDSNIKTNWTMEDILTETDMTRIFSNINTLIDRYSMVNILRLTTDFSNVNFEFFNNIEKTQQYISEFVIGGENQVKIPWTTDYIIDDNGNVVEDDAEEHILMTDNLRTGIYDIYVDAPKGVTIKAYYYVVTNNNKVYQKVEEFLSDGNRIIIPREVYHNIKIYADTDEVETVKVFVK